MKSQYYMIHGLVGYGGDITVFIQFTSGFCGSIDSATFRKN